MRLCHYARYLILGTVAFKRNTQPQPNECAIEVSSHTQYDLIPHITFPSCQALVIYMYLDDSAPGAEHFLLQEEMCNVFPACNCEHKLDENVILVKNIEVVVVFKNVDYFQNTAVFYR